MLDYDDGLRASILTANGAVGEWTVAWRYGDGRSESTCFWTQEARPFMHFTYLLKGVEQMIHTGQPTWPPSGTLLTSGGTRCAARLQEGRRQDRPHAAA